VGYQGGRRPVRLIGLGTTVSSEDRQRLLASGVDYALDCPFSSAQLKQVLLGPGA